MKKCRKCLTENREETNFCEKCGDNLAEVQSKTDVSATNNLRVQRYQKNSLVMVTIIGAISILLVSFIFYVASVKDSAKKVATTMTTTQTVSTAEEKETAATQEEVVKEMTALETKNNSAVEQQLATYDALIKEASDLTAKGEYQASSLKLAEMPASLLTNSEYKILQTLVENLTELNTIGVQEQKLATKSIQSVSSQQNSSTSTFVGKFSKWANDYIFYYGQSEQKQLFLTILSNGWVTQTNYDGTQYFGQATITEISGNVLSYNTDQLYPIERPETKQVHPNIKITINWMDNGGKQELYGYLSYSSRKVLTDGLQKSSGVNEVWITN